MGFEIFIFEIWDFNPHLSSVTGCVFNKRPIKCSQCEFDHSQKEGVLKHIQEKHPDDKGATTVFMVTEMREEIMKHLAISDQDFDPTEAYSCTKCGFCRLSR